MNAFRLVLIGLALGLLLVGLPLGSVLSVPGWQQPAQAETPQSLVGGSLVEGDSREIVDAPTTSSGLRQPESIRLTIPSTPSNEGQSAPRKRPSRSEVNLGQQRPPLPRGPREPDVRIKLEVNFQEAETRFDAILASRVVPVSHNDVGLQFVDHATWRDAPGGQAAELDKRPLAPIPDSAVSEEEPAVVQDLGGSCGGCGASDGCGGCDPCEPWRLCRNGVRGFEIGGHISSGYYANADGNPSNSPALNFNENGDELVLNQLWIYAEKAIDTGGCGWDLGGRIDYVFGVDGPDTQAFGGDGWDNEWDTNANYGSAMPQAYAEVGYNDWAVKLGHFYTITGWEVVSAPDNFFYSHSYTFAFGEPFTHTGALASYNGYQDWTFYGGWTFGWDTGFEDTILGGGGSTFLGGASWNVNDCLTFTYAISAGDFGQGAEEIFMNSLVAEVSLSERLTWIIQHDLGDLDLAGGAEAGWFGINQYLQYEINDCWAAGARIEWFQDTDGARVPGGGIGDYYALTTGLNWKPTTNVIVRPELRYDWFQGAGLPYDSGTENDQFSGGFDFILLF